MLWWYLIGETKSYTNPRTGSVFTGQPIREEEYGGYKSVVVDVGGKGYYTGEAKFWLEDEADHTGRGFLL